MCLTEAMPIPQVVRVQNEMMDVEEDDVEAENNHRNELSEDERMRNPKPRFFFIVSLLLTRPGEWCVAC